MKRLLGNCNTTVMHDQSYRIHTHRERPDRTVCKTLPMVQVGAVRHSKVYSVM